MAFAAASARLAKNPPTAKQVLPCLLFVLLPLLGVALIVVLTLPSSHFPCIFAPALVRLVDFLCDLARGRVGMDTKLSSQKRENRFVLRY